MHLKFFSYGSGDPQRAVSYLLGEKDHNGQVRPVVKVLRGQPEIVAAVAAASTNVLRYTSGMIAWSPGDQATEEEVNAVLDDFERLAFAGFEADQYSYCAVSHGDHVHFFVARLELSSGKSMNIAPPKLRLDFDHLRDYWNFRTGWSRPDDPARARHFQPGDFRKRELSDAEKVSLEAQELGISVSDLLGSTGQDVDLKVVIADNILRMVVDGSVKNRDDVRNELSSFGQVTRDGEDYISIKSHQTGKSMRFKGALFRRDFDGGTFLEAYKKPMPTERSEPDPVLAELAKRAMEAAIQRRARYNQKRYPKPTPQIRTTHLSTAADVGIINFTAQPIKEYTNADRNIVDFGGPPEGPAGRARAAFEGLVAAGRRAVAAVKSLEHAIESARRAFDWFEARRTRMELVLAEQRERKEILGDAARDIGAAAQGSIGAGVGTRPRVLADEDLAAAVSHCVESVQREAKHTDKVRQRLERAVRAMTSWRVGSRKSRPDAVQKSQ